MNVQIANLAAAVTRLTGEVQTVADNHKAIANQLTAALAQPVVDVAAVEDAVNQINAIADKLASLPTVAVSAQEVPVP